MLQPSVFALRLVAKQIASRPPKTRTLLVSALSWAPVYTMRTNKLKGSEQGFNGNVVGIGVYVNAVSAYGFRTLEYKDSLAAHEMTACQANCKQDRQNLTDTRVSRQQIYGGPVPKIPENLQSLGLVS
jgi:hypothetical protein